MGKRGPRPEPTTLKLLRGNPGKQKLNDSEPSPDALEAMPEPPGALGEVGLKRWVEDGARLIAVGVITVLDLPAFWLYCAAWDEVAECESEIKAEAYYFSESGYPVPHPALARRRVALDRIRKYQQEFGMTPSSRSAVKAVKPKQSGVASRRRA